MAGDWREVSVEEIKAPRENALATGPFGSSIGSRFFVNSGVPVIRGSNLSDDVGTRLNDDDLVFLTPEKARQFSRSTVREGDLIFTCWGTVNQVGLVDSRAAYKTYVISNKQMKLTPDPEKVNSLFLYYLFSSPQLQDRIRNQSIGSSVPGFNLGQLRAMRLRLPTLDEQCAIAQILGGLDDKIELNRQLNETLEAMARALFKSWFVDFDPVRAKSEGREAGVPAPIAGLFPNSFEDSDFGEMPAGWTIQGLDDVARFLNGLALQKYPPRNDRWLPVIKIAQLRAGGTRGADRAAADIPAEYVVDDGDVLFSWSGSLECVLWAGGEGALNQHLFKVTSHEFPRWFYYLWIHEHLHSFRHIAAGKATTMGHIQRHHLTDAKVVVPNRSVLDQADAIIGPLLGQVVRRRVESRSLAAVRDELLPKLMSGDCASKTPSALPQIADAFSEDHPRMICLKRRLTRRQARISSIKASVSCAVRPPL